MTRLPRSHTHLASNARATRRSFAIGPVVLVAATIAAGCASVSREDGYASGTSAAAARTPDAGAAPVSLTPEEELERLYLIGPAVARPLGYRIDWQHPSPGTRLRSIVPQEDSVFTLDENNFLTRIRREDGSRIWRIPVGRPLDEILGITFVPELERVYLTTGGSMLVLDSDSGSLVAKQKLGRVANTAPIRVGQFLLYGSRSGQLVWYSHRFASVWRAYQISQSVQLAPVRDGRYVVAVGNDGRVMCLDGNSASQVWSRRALAPITAPPAVGNGVVYVASRDQHLRAFELDRDRTPLWEHLTESPLTEGPSLIGDRVYQQVPGRGLLCLEAMPRDRPGGVVIWEAEEIDGNVLTSTDGALVTWARESGRLALVDDRQGAVIEWMDVPQVDSILATAPEDGDLYAAGDDGRLIRLVVRR